ncbi:hypothetical protein QN224_29925 [Sinorhizobium sp. 8-89]|uniref:hypothetical protein n=1 Tax=Sinorhizobium sp. 7-81 TaxID=3049087 RepID=UPI0024C2B36A|nr:hypothetical protein [Sinorhizobium sp. 7-81]MDK1389602.1 hypothetical protein [Sinorhizobium sp. 7-81]
MSSTVLALLTALISVVSVAGPALYQLVHNPRSKTVLMTPSIDGTTLRVVAVNEGDAPAAFILAATRSDYLAGATKIRLRNDADAIIPPGSKLLTFDIIPLLTKEESYRNSLEMLQLVVQKKEATDTAIAFEIAESDGKRFVASFPLSAEDLFFLMRANSDRCSGIQSPDFTNGCIGPGTLERDADPLPRATEYRNAGR